MNRATTNQRRRSSCPRMFAATWGGVLLLSAGVAQACNVPVFRYALEHWRADPYRVVLFHDGPLSETEQSLVRPLEEQQDQSLANLTFRAIDVNELDAAARELFVSQQEPQLPWLVVQYPEHLRISAPVWAGPLAEKDIAGLTTSPVRQELIRRLAEGQTAVWLLLESGEAEKDNAAAARIEEELKQLELTLPLPELSASPEDQLLADVPLRVAFSLLRVPRNDAEQALVAMLLQSEPDLAERSDPMVFPVFGRGRALLPLIGAGITTENIRDSATFLVGPCSCQVKELNPGFDLLLTDAWDTLISQEIAPQPVTATLASLPSEPELVPIPTGAPSAAAATATAPAPVVTANQAFTTEMRKAWIIGGIALAGLLLLVGVAAMAFRAHFTEV